MLNVIIELKKNVADNNCWSIKCDEVIYPNENIIAFNKRENGNLCVHIFPVSVISHIFVKEV